MSLKSVGLIRRFGFVCVILALSGCVRQYQSPASGSAAEVVFSSPNLKGEALGFTDVTLFINHATRDCERIELGKIGISPGDQERHFKLEAEVRAYMSVQFFVNGFGYTKRANVDFSFIPESNARYNLRFLSFQDHMEVNLFEESPDGTLVKVVMDKYGVCKPEPYATSI